MKAASVREIKYELNTRSHSELLELCMRLSKFKKENKELLTYLLYEVSDEKAYIENIKSEINHEFEEINTASYFYIRKSVRKILRMIKKYIRYSKKKETEIELLIYFCSELKKLGPFKGKNVSLDNLFKRQIASIEKTVSSMHEDLQYDYNLELNTLK
ncbi:MAG: hypothetical protein GY834_04840 [Bacteroidetes bacterium]|nr:hypothetical protein [Bacteroidota bacterium]